MSTASTDTCEADAADDIRTCYIAGLRYTDDGRVEKFTHEWFNISVEVTPVGRTDFDISVYDDELEDHESLLSNQLLSERRGRYQALAQALIEIDRAIKLKAEEMSKISTR